MTGDYSQAPEAALLRGGQRAAALGRKGSAVLGRMGSAMDRLCSRHLARLGALLGGSSATGAESRLDALSARIARLSMEAGLAPGAAHRLPVATGTPALPPAPRPVPVHVVNFDRLRAPGGIARPGLSRASSGTWDVRVPPHGAKGTALPPGGRDVLGSIASAGKSILELRDAYGMLRRGKAALLGGSSATGAESRLDALSARIARLSRASSGTWEVRVPPHGAKGTALPPGGRDVLGSIASAGKSILELRDAYGMLRRGKAGSAGGRGVLEGVLKALRAVDSLKAAYERLAGGKEAPPSARGGAAGGYPAPPGRPVPVYVVNHAMFSGTGRGGGGPVSLKNVKDVLEIIKDAMELGREFKKLAAKLRPLGRNVLELGRKGAGLAAGRLAPMGRTLKTLFTTRGAAGLLGAGRGLAALRTGATVASAGAGTTALLAAGAAAAGYGVGTLINKGLGRLFGIREKPGEKWYEGGIGGWLGDKLYDAMHPEEAKLMNENKINLTVNIDEKGRLTTVSDDMDTKVDGRLNRGEM